MTGKGQEDPLSPCLDEVKMGLGCESRKKQLLSVLLMYMPSTSTLTNELSGQVHRPTLLFANTSASCQSVLHRSREEEVEALHLTVTVREKG